MKHRLLSLGMAVLGFATIQLAQASPIVGSWFFEGSGTTFVGTFLSDGRYMEARIVSGDPAHTGIEYGNYSWNAITGEITATSLADTNGNWGFAGDVDGNQYMLVSGNSANLFQPTCPGCGTTLSRVLTGASPIVGSWFGGTTVVGTFLADGRYMMAAFVSGDPAHTGLEWGNYSWNAITGEITATSLVDTNGNWGFAGDVDGNHYMLVSGNSANLFQPTCPECSGTVLRVNPIPEPDSYALMLTGLALLGFGVRSKPQWRRVQ